MIRCMLYSASLGTEFWSDALIYAAYLYNRTQHATIGKTPFEAWTHTQPDLSHLRTFGTPITVRRPGKRPTKLDPHVYHGIFLRFAGTVKNVVYYDVKTRQTKVATHKDHDEFHFGLSPAHRSRASQHLISIASDNPKDADLHGKPNLDGAVPDTYVEHQRTASERPAGNIDDIPQLPTAPPAAAVAHTQGSSSVTIPTLPCQGKDPRQPFYSAPTVQTLERVSEDVLNISMSVDIFGPSIQISIPLTGKDSTLGFRFYGDHRTPTVRECLKGSPAGKLKNWRSRLRHNTIRGINGEFILTRDEFTTTIANLRRDGHTECTLTIACEEIPHPHSTTGVPQLHFDQLHAIAHHLHVLRYGKDHDLWGENEQPHLSDETVHQTVAEEITPVRLTRRYLLKRPDWPKWEAAEFKQLDSYQLQQMFGTPIPKPSGNPTPSSPLSGPTS